MALYIDSMMTNHFPVENIDPFSSKVFSTKDRNIVTSDDADGKHPQIRSKYINTFIPGTPTYDADESHSLTFKAASTEKIAVEETHKYVFLVLGISTVLGLISVVTCIVLRRRRKFRRMKYQEELTILPKKKISNPVDPAFYNYVCPQKPIDFVVPVSSTQCAVNSNGSLFNSPIPSATSSNVWNEMTLDSGSSLLGGLNPDLYIATPDIYPEEFDFPEGHRGRVWFSIDYSATLERLSLHLIKIKNLPPRIYGSPNSRDPFVRVCLMPDERRYLQSRVRKKNCNPFIDETLLFQLPSRGISERMIKISVYDNERGKHHNIIGHALVTLNDINLFSSTPIIQWRDLEQEPSVQMPCDFGEMMISLCYNKNLERLIVTVCEAKNLRPPERCHSLDTYVKITFLKGNKMVKIKKTMTARNSINPKYNESFHFKLAQSSISVCSILLQVTQSGVKQKDKNLGRVILGSYMFSRGKSLEHWEEAMSAGHKQIRYWHKLTC